MKDVMWCNAVWHHEMIYLQIPNTLSTVYTWYSSKIHREIMTQTGLARSIYRHERSPRFCADDLNALSQIKQIPHRRSPRAQIIIVTFLSHRRYPRVQIIITRYQHGWSPLVRPLLIPISCQCMCTYDIKERWLCNISINQMSLWHIITLIITIIRVQ